MKLLIIILLPISAICQQVFSAGGNAPSYSSTGEKTVSFTIGEMLIATAKSTKNHITQGFQQPNERGRIYINGINAFSPNNDNNNDTWLFKSRIENYTIEIFSRWGNIVWDNKKDIKISEWAGTDQDNNPLPDGTYFYTIKEDEKLLENGTGYIEITR